MNKKITLYFLSLLVFLNISATPKTCLASSIDETQSSIQIERAADGTSKITFDGEGEYGYSFTVPDGWYPIAIPATSEEIEKFKGVAEENHLVLNEEQLNKFLSTKDDVEKLHIYDLNPEHRQGHKKTRLTIGDFTIPESAPDWALTAILKASLESVDENSDEITQLEFEEIDNQQIGIMEISLPNGEGEFVRGKVFLFVRNGKLVSFFGATNNDEWLPDVKDVMDSIFASFDFDIEH
jgi:hypothetical protein